MERIRLVLARLHAGVVEAMHAQVLEPAARVSFVIDSSRIVASTLRHGSA
jgi:hypothetical protein